MSEREELSEARYLEGVEQQCDGSRDCQASRHMHGCWADSGNCDHPDEHGDGEPFHGSHY